MRYTRPHLVDIVKNQWFVKELSESAQTRVETNLNNLMSGLVAKGLTYVEAEASFHSSGRPEHLYDAQELLSYLKSVLGRPKTLKWAIAHSIIDHLEFIGYEVAQGTPSSSSERSKRELIFGKEASDEYYRD